MRRTLALLALALALGLGLRSACADEGLVRLAQLGDPEDAQHEAALAWWEQQGRAGQIPLLHRALLGSDPALARVAARALGHSYLSAAELERKMAILLRHPEDVYADGPDWGHGGRRAIGSPELVPYLRAVMADTTGTLPTSSIATSHRVARGEHLAELVPLLEQGSPAAFRGLLFVVGNIGEYDWRNRHRALVAKGLYYGLLRLRAQRAGTPLPKLADTRVRITSTPENGLPTAALALARATHPKAANGFKRTEAEVKAKVSQVQPFLWLQRWLADLTPNATDIEFLHDVVALGLSDERSIYNPALVHWAVRHLATLPGAAGRATVEAWATETDLRAWYAATALARTGERAQFDRLRAALDAGKLPRKQTPSVDFTWFVDRAEARARLARHLTRFLPAEINASHFLTAPERSGAAHYEGLHIDEADLDALADVLWDAHAHGGVKATRTLGRFHTHVHPGGLDAQRTAALLEALRAVIDDDIAAWKWEDEYEWKQLLALLEVRDRAGTIRLLGHWLESTHDGRAFVLEQLMCLGVPGHIKAMTDHWARLERRWMLGRVPGKPVDTFLTSKRIPNAADATSESVLEALDALLALLLRAGLPVTVRPIFEALQLEADDEPAALARLVEAAWQDLDNGDVVPAILRLTEAAPYGLHGLGGIDDPRVHERLRDLRIVRHRGEYWTATAALSGTDLEASQEIVDLLLSGRTWILNNLTDGGVPFGPRDVLFRVLTEGLDSNCCLGWISHVLLKEIVPWLPFDDGFGGAGTAITRAYLAAHTWQHSEIFGGLVPGLP